MNKSKVIDIVTNIILSVIYLIISFIGILMPMATEVVMGQYFSLNVLWTYIYSYVSFFMFAICAGSLIWSYFLYKKKHLLSSCIVRFIPVYICGFLVIADFIINKFIQI